MFRLPAPLEATGRMARSLPHPIRTRSFADLHHRALARGFASHEYGQACYPKIKLASEDENRTGARYLGRSGPRRSVGSNSALKLARDRVFRVRCWALRHGWRRCTAIAHAAARPLMLLAKLD
jgi:hypothetical protein